MTSPAAATTSGTETAAAQVTPSGAASALTPEAALEQLLGHAASFRDGQREAIVDLVEHRRRVLVVQRTGWGKSAVYFVATRMLRTAGAGPTLIISPLLALMRDQLAAAARAGIRGVTMNSANAHEWDEVRQQLAADEVDVLLVSPERLNNPAFRAEMLPELSRRIGLLVVDEAHCISDWGHDFRPDYRRIRDVLNDLGGNVPVVATTATANARVVRDVAEQLAYGSAGDTPSGGAHTPHEVVVHRGPLARASLRLGVLGLPQMSQRLGWLLEHLKDLDGTGIIYCLTVSAAEDTAALLRQHGYEVQAYTGRTEPAERESLEDDLRHNRLKALVATSALGMGFDKPDLGFVLHLGAPSSAVSYYQQVGRAGRATENADVLLLPGSEDKAIWEYFATSSMPDPAQAQAVISALADGGVLSTAALETIADAKRSRLELLLKVLDVEGAIQKVQGGWQSTGAAWAYDAGRYERVAQARAAEAQAMLDYQRTPGCRMRFIAEALDDPAAADCGRCDRCAAPWYPTDVTADAAGRANAALQQVGVEVENRKMWPSGMNRLGVPASGRIAADEQAASGRVIARLTDLGWGQKLRELFAATPDGSIADGPPEAALLDAAIQVLAGWGWSDRPVAVMAMPSRTRPQFVQGLAAHLGQVGRLPYLGALEYGAVPPAGRAGNSAFRLAEVWDQFELTEAQRAQLAELTNSTPCPILLVDDLIDSRWSLTVAARLLRQSGASAVLPFAAASVA